MSKGSGSTRSSSSSSPRGLTSSPITIAKGIEGIYALQKDNYLAATQTIYNLENTTMSSLSAVDDIGVSYVYGSLSDAEFNKVKSDVIKDVKSAKSSADLYQYVNNSEKKFASISREVRQKEDYIKNNGRSDSSDWGGFSSTAKKYRAEIKERKKELKTLSAQIGLYRRAYNQYNKRKYNR